MDLSDLLASVDSRERCRLTQLTDQLEMDCFCVYDVVADVLVSYQSMPSYSTRTVSNKSREPGVNNKELSLRVQLQKQNYFWR
jgi:hypothetical protein